MEMIQKQTQREKKKINGVLSELWDNPKQPTLMKVVNAHSQDDWWTPL